jgi:hypothetical protein
MLLLLLFVPAIARADAIAGGEHVRIETERGAVHVWTPRGYRAERAGIALYVHGYYTDVDRAWTAHHLPEQFAASRRNALFIAPEAPAGVRGAVRWASLDELVVEVRRRAGLRRPSGPIVALVHSGGYRTAVRWLDDPELDQVALIDALYGDETSFATWLGASPHHRLLAIGGDTIRWTEPFARDAAAAGASVRVYDQLPARASDLPRVDRDVQLLYFRSQYSHMDLAAAGRAIPLALELSALPRLDQPAVSP